MKEILKDNKELKFYIHTFGCQMNENDSERIAGILTAAGAKKSDSPDKSDLLIVNTCAVREKAEEKLSSYLGNLALFKKGRNVSIGVVGCVAQLHKSKLMDKKPFIDFVLGPDNYNQLTHIIKSTYREKFISTNWSPELDESLHKLTLRKSKISAYVTIMEGCNNFCSYCIVPYTRGREKFRLKHNILREVQDLVSQGYKEIFLLGQNVNSYVDPKTGEGFSSLLKEINSFNGIEWIRFITSHPKNFNKDIASIMKESEKVCHQLHLPIQSGSSSVLERMNRKYTREEYLKKITFIRDLMPDVSLSTDIIVGFPGETEEEFQDTLSLLREVRYTNIFSFRYSPRPLTAASKEKETVSIEEKRRRLIEVQKLQKNIQIKLNKTFIGRVVKVLCSGKSKKDPHIYTGRNDGHQVVNFKSQKNVIGQFVDVQISSCGPYSLFGETD